MSNIRERDIFYNGLPENLGDYIHSRDFLEPIETALDVKVYYPDNPPLSVKECPRDAFNRIFPFASGCRGAYDVKKNIIWLPYDGWCRKTLIHEALHAMSHFAYDRYTEVGRVKLLNEGIAEFLTGYVLYKNFEKCYDVWLNGYMDCCKGCPYLEGMSCRYCRLSYSYEVKIVYILAECVGIREIIDLFIYKPNKDWKTIYQQFLDRHSIVDELYIGRKIQHNNFSEKFKYAIIDAFELDEEEIEDILKSNIKDIIDFSKF